MDTGVEVFHIGIHFDNIILPGKGDKKIKEVKEDLKIKIDYKDIG